MIKAETGYISSVQQVKKIETAKQISKKLQCNYLNRGTWKKIVQSQQFLKTKDSQVFWQTEQ